MLNFCSRSYLSDFGQYLSDFSLQGNAEVLLRVWQSNYTERSSEHPWLVASEQPWVCAPLNCTADLAHPRSWCDLLLSPVVLDHSEVYWLPPISLSLFVALSPGGKECCGFSELSVSCWILLQSKGEISFLPIIIIIIIVINSKIYRTFVLHLLCVLLLLSSTWLWRPFLGSSQTTSLCWPYISNSPE